MKILSSVLAAAALTAIAHPVLADDSPSVTESAHHERAISINANPFGLIQGYYGINGEYLHGAHGVLVEGSYFHKGDDDSSVGGASGTIGYRWHWRGRQNSGFLGVNAQLGVGSGTTTVDDNGTKMSYDLSIRTIAVTANVGKRWQFNNGINITARIGGGWASRTASTTSTDPDAIKATEAVEELLAFLPIALDGELSAGYSF